MATNEDTTKDPWETPEATALTDTGARADQADTQIRNGPAAPSLPN